MAIEIASLLVGDPAGAWKDLGFVVDGECSHVSGIAFVLGGPERGVRQWGLRHFSADDGLDGLPGGGPVAAAEPTPDHPNGVVSLDHLVVTTPDLGRTIERLEEAGVELRRTRDAGRAHQAFFKLGAVILEVVGPPRPTGDGPARFMGLAWTVADLDATAAFFGDRLHPAKEAVQPGRRIATLDKAAGSTVPMAFMTS